MTSLLGAALAVSVALAASVSARASEAESPIDLALYAELLEQHTRTTSDVVGVRVDYAAIGKAPDWKPLVAQVESARPSRLDRDARIAFWINAYNILTIDLILDHYPVDGIKEIGSFFSPVWDVVVARIEGEDRSLGQIEHEILRPMGEPRIHGAIVCASTSCPPLARTPFRPGRLDADLDAAMRAWLSSDEKGIRIDRAAKRVRISKIFDWFEEDFEAAGGPLALIARYLPSDDAAWLRQHADQLSVAYFGYDWSLNDTRR